MKRLYLPLLLLVALVIQSTAMDLVPVKMIQADYFVVPHWVLMIVTMIAIFYDYDQTYYSVMYGIIFGLFIDMMYTDMLGVYMFTYGIIAYIVHTIKKVLHANLVVAVLLGLLAVILGDSLIYILYRFIGETTMYWQSFILIRLIPTTFANIVFLLIFYPFIQKRLMNWSSEQVTRPKSV